MMRLDIIRNVLVSVFLLLAVLPACSAQGSRQTQEQRESAGSRPTRSESIAKETLNTAGEATLVVVVLGVCLAAAALPVLLVVFLL